MPPEIPIPFYQPTTDKEWLQYLAKLPHRRCQRPCKPMDIGLWDECKRNQLDLFSPVKGGSII